jgi:hypothetical protein
MKVLQMVRKETDAVQSDALTVDLFQLEALVQKCRRMQNKASPEAVRIVQDMAALVEVDGDKPYSNVPDKVRLRDMVKELKRTQEHLYAPDFIGAADQIIFAMRRYELTNSLD